ncbi:MAG TPA: LysM peptidoglycan-binding domain-containing protein [Amycolatopsis sp.]|uniref:LysM peptidoglycan-binding domain-containing protein n=1 Tax=Amycolatopsis sp. TaxID=37632 RepID=UPI002B49B00A|nr:LysM peptidoglycan-binding domain-containing protein [Amycolatopsis sp.]HKS44756.1 LysM peptidoglycan-binding domain-containing protein [Amycolatopsis sp.]
MNTLVSPRPNLGTTRGLWRAVRRLLTGRARLAVLGVLLVCAAAGVLATALTSSDTQAVPATPAVPAPAPVVTAPAPTTPPAPATAASTITLHRGDTLWALARHHHTTVADLQSLNKLGNSTLIRAGATLQVPTTTPATQPTPARGHQTTPAGHQITPTATPAHPGKQVTPKPGEPAVRQIVATIFGSEYGCAANVIARESGWNIHATNPHSGAYGLAQALPGSKMARSGPNWRTDATTQLAWMRDYVTSRYGGACKAWTYWQAHHWY